MQRDAMPCRQMVFVSDWPVNDAPSSCTYPDASSPPNPPRSQELADLTRNPLPGITISASESNVYSWTATIAGPQDTPYAGGLFDMALEFPVEYPFKGPKIKFHTRIYHPNIDADGNLCIGLLKSDAWKPSTKAETSECGECGEVRDVAQERADQGCSSFCLPFCFSFCFSFHFSFYLSFNPSFRFSFHFSFHPSLFSPLSVYIPPLPPPQSSTRSCSSWQNQTPTTPSWPALQNSTTRTEQSTTRRRQSTSRSTPGPPRESAA